MSQLKEARRNLGQGTGKAFKLVKVSIRGQLLVQYMVSESRSAELLKEEHIPKAHLRCYI